jgi:acetyl-CoA synthetase
MLDETIYGVPANIAAHAHIKDAQYKEMYERSISDPEGFWNEQAEKFLTWFRPWDKVLEWDFTRGHIRWLEGG